MGCQEKVILHSELLQERRVFVGKYLREIKLEPNQARSLAQPAAGWRWVCNSLAAFSDLSEHLSETVCILYTLTESLISFKGDFVIFAAKLKDDSLLLKERLLSHNGEFVSIKGWKNNGGNVVFNGRIVIEP